jgi:hypothetical protein
LDGPYEIDEENEWQWYHMHNKKGIVTEATNLRIFKAYNGATEPYPWGQVQYTSIVESEFK